MRELDLHGLTVDEAIKTFVDHFNRHVRSSREPLRIIHGWGSSGEGGRIRREFRQFLAEATDSLDWQPGEDFEGNLGVTIVYPRKVLHSAGKSACGSAREFLFYAPYGIENYGRIPHA